MKLKKFRVTNYRSVEDSGEVEIDNMLCLVGKNEAGKTAMLQAIAGLNPHPSTLITFDKETDYPRRYLRDYSTRHPDKEAVVINTTWEISESNRALIIETLGPDSLKSNLVKIQRRYGGAIEWELPINYSNVVTYLIEDERLTVQERKTLSDAATTDILRATLEAISERAERQQRLLDRLKKFPNSNATGFVQGVLAEQLPQFMYFSHYDRMVGQIRVDNLAQRAASGPPLDVGENVFLDFLEFAGTSADEISNATTYESLNARCEAASNTITDQLREYWTQNPFLEIEVRVTKAESGDPAPFNAGVIVRNRVRNTLHRVTVPFSERSAGFIWFFSFLVKFAQVQKSGRRLVLLLDEPGLTLHGKAQEDLLRYFDDKLVPDHQLIFSTHSPFMVPADQLESCRIVEDKIKQSRPGIWTTDGTKVRNDVLAVDPDTLFALQGALGYEVTQTLFVGKNTLLVEGPGDFLYLKAWSAALAKRGKVGLDRRWTICPAGGIDKIQSFVSLFAGANLNVAALTDYAKTDHKKLDALRRSNILQEGRLVNFATILEQEEADVEDVFSSELYLDIVNSAFDLSEDKKLTTEKIETDGAGLIRLLKRVEASFKLLSVDVPEFDHYSPAEWLIRNPQILDGSSSKVIDTLARAEKVVAKLNGMLPSA